MAKTEKEYVRLPGRGMRRQGLISAGRAMTSLWLGKDHLLYLENRAGYTESYKRFYYRDIQAFILGKTQSGLIWNLVLGLLFLLCALPAVMVHDTVGKAFLIFLAFVFGIILLIHWLYGPTCVCYIKTAVQTEELPSLSRLPRALKVIERLRSRIAEAQGELTGEQVAASFRTSILASVPETPPVVIPPAPVISPETMPNYFYSGGAHTALFYLLLVDGLIKCVYLLHQFAILIPLGAIVSLAAVICLALALTKQHSSLLDQRLRRITWTALGAYGGRLIISTAYAMMLLMFKSGTLADRSPWKDPLLLGLLVVAIGLNFGVGAYGLFAMREFKRSQEPPPLPVAN